MLKTLNFQQKPQPVGLMRRLKMTSKTIIAILQEGY